MNRESLNALMADGCFIAGLASLGTGLWWIYPAATLIAVGLVLIALSLASNLRPQGKPPQER